MSTYRQHYERCKTEFGDSKIDIENLNFDQSLEKTPEYNQLIESLSTKAANTFNDKSKYNSETFIKDIKDTLIFPEINLIHDYFYDQISNNFFGSDYTTNRVQICKSSPTNADLSASWLWHYDDNGPTHIKLFIYLSDVNSKDDGAFCYAINNDGLPVKVLTSKIGPQQRTKQVFPSSRVPQEFIDSQELKEQYVLGKKGECFLFDPNIIHKGTVPASGHERIALIYHYHPVTRKTELFNFLRAGVKDYILR